MGRKTSEPTQRKEKKERRKEKAPVPVKQCRTKSMEYTMLKM
jgi:hypothetical protein